MDIFFHQTFIMADIFNVGLFGLFVQITAYIAPYFLIPAAFRAGMGAFGALTGIVNDRSRGLFDRAKKGRQEARARGWEGFKAGQGNRNALSRSARVKGMGMSTGAFLASDRKLGLLTSSARRETASATWGNMVAARYGKDPRTESSRENDDQSRVQTYLTAQAARADLTNKWRTKDENGNDVADTARIERGIAAATNNGGFGKAQQNFAARQLSRTGTGYKDIKDLHEVINRVAGDNTSMAADLLGEINATTKQASRNDLAAGFGKHLAAYEKSRARVKAGGTAELTVEENRELHLQAAKDMDSVTAIRMKTSGVENSSKALRESFELAQQTAADVTLSPIDQQRGRMEAARLAGVIAKLEQAGTYGSATNIDAAADFVIEPTSGRGQTRIVMGPNGNPIVIPLENSGRQSVVAAAGKVQTKIDEVTGKSETIYDLDNSTGTISPRGTPQNAGGSSGSTGARGTAFPAGPRRPLTDEDTQRPIFTENPEFDQDVSDTYYRHAPQARGQDPNDPNM